MKKILVIISIPIAFALLSLPVLALSDDAMTLTIRFAQTIASFKDLIMEVVLWFVFFTLAAFFIYFMANTIILIDNNRRYRYFIHIDEKFKTKKDKLFQNKTLFNIKSAEKRLILLGVIISIFILMYIVLSAYLYLDTPIVQHTWLVIYYGIAILTMLIIFYGLIYAFRKIQYSSFPEGDSAKPRLYASLTLIKKRLKFFVITIMLLIMLYMALLTVIAKGVTDLTG